MANLTAITGNWHQTAGSNTSFSGVATVAADEITIPTGVTVTIPASVTVACRSLTVASGGTLVFAATSSRVGIGDATAGTGNVALSIAATATITLTGVGTIDIQSTSAAAQTVTTNGKTLPNVNIIGGATGATSLQDAITCSLLALISGTFNSNNHAVMSGVLQTSGSSARTLTLGSSTVTLTSATPLNFAANTNLTVTANTATITCSATSAGPTCNNTNWNGASLVLSGSGGVTLTNGGTWANVTRTGTAATTDSFVINTAGPVVTGTFTITGNSATNRVLVYSNTLGTPRVITAAAVSLTDVDFMDIAIVGPTGSTITSDSFDRADGALGTTDAAAGGSPLAWTANDGTWNIDTNKAASTSSGLVYRSATVDAGVTDMAVEAVVTPGSQIWGLNARFTDQNNRIFVQHNGTQLAAGQVQGGTSTTVFTANVSFSAGDRFRVVLVGNGIAAYKNDVFIVSGVITYALTGTRAGLTTYGTDAVRRFDDFKVLAAPAVTGTRLGDCLGNSGIAFTTASGTARDGGGAGVKRYAVAAGNFSSTAMWSETSGGSPGASVPLPQDDVYLDANSAAGTYTMNMPRVCRNLDATGFTRSLTNTAVTTTSYGSFNVPATSTIVGTNTWVANLYGRGTHTLSLPVMQFYSNLNINIAAVGGTYTLASVIDTRTSTSTNNLLNILCGTFNTANYDMYIGQLVPGTATSLPCTVNLGTSTCYLGYNTSTIPYQYQGTPVLNASSATIIYVKDSNNGVLSRTFQGGNQVYGTLTCIVADTPGSLTITGSNTFNTVNIGSGRSLKLTSGTTQKIGTLNLNGSPRGGVRLPGSQSAYLSSPDSAAVSVTGDLTIDCKVTKSDWTPSGMYESTLVSKWATGQLSYKFVVNGSTIGINGQLRFHINGLSASSTVATGVTDNTAKWVRASYTQNASTGNVNFYLSDDGVTWTQLGTTVALATTATLDGTALLLIGSQEGGANYYESPSIYHRARIYNSALGTGAGTPVFDTDFSNQFGQVYVDSSTNGAIVTPSATLANVGDGRVVIESVTAGSAATLQVDTVTGMNYVDLKDVVMNGADTYIEATSVIRSNVKGVRRGPKTGMSMMMGV